MLTTASSSASQRQTGDRLSSNLPERTELWAETCVGGVMFMDDRGAQRPMLVSPALWRRVFKPLYRDSIDLAHRFGKCVFVHSDGHIADIIPDLVELGLDALNAQVFCMDMEDLGQQFWGKLTFWGEIDRQHILPFGSAAAVVNAVKRVKEALHHNGGVIAQCEFGPGARPENVYLVFQT
jgi:uroporphyrinogen decarboxylase